LTGFNLLLPGIDLSLHSSTTVSAPEWASMSKSINEIPIDNVPGAPPPEDTTTEETIDSHKSNLTCTTYQAQTQALREVVGVENAGGKVYGKATEFYNQHPKYSELWNLWHLFKSTQNFPQAR